MNTLRSSMIEILGPAEIEKMRASGLLAAACLRMASKEIAPGLSTERLNKLCADFVRDHGGISAPLNYKGFPKSICTSINEVVCHGIPSKKDVLKEGDIINVDVTTILHGYHGDTSRTFAVGEISDEAKLVIETAEKSMYLGIDTVRPGSRVRDIGAAIEDYAQGRGCSVVRDYCGHGIHRVFHAEPQIPHYRFRGANPRFKKGMTFTVEPMINLGSWRVKLLGDGWTVKTTDGRLSAQFEHTVLVTEDGHDILTDWAKLAGTKYD